MTGVLIIFTTLYFVNNLNIAYNNSILNTTKPVMISEKPTSETAVLIDLAKFMQGDFFKDKRIGSFNTGILGYFSNRQVTNLDGLINSKEYHNIMKAGKVNDYLKENFDVFVEYHAGYITTYTSLGFELFNVRTFIENPVKIYNSEYNDGPDYRIYVRKDQVPEFKKHLDNLDSYSYIDGLEDRSPL